MAWTTKSPIWGNHWVPLGCKALLGSIKYLQIKENSWYMYVLYILKSIGILFIKFESIKLYMYTFYIHVYVSRYICINVNVKLIEYFKILDALIGVHCTHGVNRTGYLICRYLIEKMDWDPQKAIDGKVINFEKNYQLYCIMYQ